MYTDQLPPPPPAVANPPLASSPSRPKRRWWIPVTICLGGLALAGGISTLVLAMSAGESNDAVTVRYSIEVVTDEYCADFDDTGYDDLPFAEAEVVDGSGNVLGFGTLDDGVDTDTSCIFTATIRARTSPDGIYRVTAGNANRGYVNFSEADIDDGVLNADAIID